MGTKIFLLFAVAASVCKVQSQRCGCATPAPTIISTPPVLNTPIATPVSTTIIDNSVSNALANALQLLIVSDLIESTVGPVLANNIVNAPLVETINSPYCSPFEIISQSDYITPCGQTVELIQPCTPMVETLSPNIFGGYTETLSPLFGSSGPLVERFTPNIYGGLAETLSPLYRTGIIERTCGSGPIIEKIQPNIFGGYTETFSPMYGSIVEQLLPNGYSIMETITPNFCGGVTEVITQNPFFNGVTEVVNSPCSLSPNQYVSNCFGGVTEIVSGPPMAAEVLFPSSIPAQLTCNFGYNVPSKTPCVNFNVEPLPFEPCFNNIGKSYFI